MTRKQKQRGTREAKPTLTREEFARISAIEGVSLTAEAEAMFEDFDRRGLSDEQRRAEIIRRFKAKGGIARLVTALTPAPARTH